MRSVRDGAPLKTLSSKMIGRKCKLRPIKQRNGTNWSESSYSRSSEKLKCMRLGTKNARMRVSLMTWR